MAFQLRIGKTTAHSAARQLELAGVVRRRSTPGSRRVLYEMSEGYNAIFAAYLQRARDALAMVERGMALACGSRARARLATMRGLYEAWLRGGEEITRRWNQRRRRTR
jgi:hypothetical protein